MTNAQGSDTDARRATRVRALLGLGALAGLALATAGILEPAPGDRIASGASSGAAAVVNGSIIPTATYERAIAALTRDTREPLDEADRVRVLDRLIEEELLVQRAIELGMDKTDPAVRNTLVSAMIETIVSGVGQTEPSAEAVAAFYEQNAGFFAGTDRFRVRRLRIPIRRADGTPDEEAARARAEEAVARLRKGEAVASLERDLGGETILPLPDGFLPASKLREYLGPTAARSVYGMQDGDVSAPIRVSDAFLVLKMVERRASPRPALDAVEPQVRAEMRRRAGDQSLRDYLDTLREAATIVLPAS